MATCRGALFTSGVNSFRRQVALFAGLIPMLSGIFAVVAADATGPTQGAALLKTDVMGVFAHPDDETGAAALLATYALGKGATVANVYCTRGEGGGNMVGTQAGPALGILREAELRYCLGKLGVRHCYFLGQADFAYTESLSVTLEKWGHEETLRRLVRLVRALRPEVIVTMNPAPTAGQHGNHQAAGLLAIEAFDLAADAKTFPEQIADEGLRPWQPRKLYFGGPAGTGATIAVDRPLPDGRTPAQVAGEALSHHRSQAFGNFGNSPWLRRPQNLALVKSVVPFATDETDLMRGLPVADPTPARVLAPGDGVAESGFQLAFVPRPAVERYRRWVKEQRIEHAASEFAADVPVVAGEVNDVFLRTFNPTADGANAVVDFTPPPGWKLNFEQVNVRFSPAVENRMRVLVTPPEGFPADAELTATTTIAGTVLKTTTRLHPVPSLRVRHVAEALAVGTDDAAAAWVALPVHAIPHTRTWQGTVTDAADCSGGFRIAHDGATLFVEVRVHDDVVVGNIAPDDIKGHWRSDSVELCIDPQVGAEHTLGCYKLGIFPFDSTGKVRAARDADANAGPVEVTAPGTKIASWRTADGYAIRVSVPFSELGLKPSKEAARFGLNVLIYDGDKAGAAPGENINKSRLAWAPRSGVQGRPEDWGRADLE
ncbi:MAG: PIG-L family deacetylase [Verrucomicrobiota bacterium]